jgi:pyrroloquinoline quinone biosynthesis protein B
LSTAHARVLGIAQDAGVPHVGCACKLCERFRAGPLKVTCLGLAGPSGRTYLIDATPDFNAQTAALPAFPSAILLTHAHVGHYTGLVYLGREGVSAERMPVHATPAMCDFLGKNEPWRSLRRDGYVVYQQHEAGSRFELEPGLEGESLEVPHRNELSDTVAYLIRGPSRTLLYLPDIDSWERWELDLPVVLDGCDAALLDGSFFSADELGLRSVEEVPHPPIETTLELLDPDRTRKVRFVHLNHSNPALIAGSAPWKRVNAAGGGIAQEGERLSL